MATQEPSLPSLNKSQKDKIMETLLDDIILLKQDYPQLTFTVTFDETTKLHIKGQTKEADIPLKNLSITDIRNRIRLFLKID